MWIEAVSSFATTNRGRAARGESLRVDDKECRGPMGNGGGVSLAAAIVSMSRDAIVHQHDELREKVVEWAEGGCCLIVFLRADAGTPSSLAD